MTVRQDYIYPNLPRDLMEVVDICIANIYKNGIQVYSSRKEFIVKAINVLIEYEKARHQDLEKVLENNNNNRKNKGGNRIHVNNK